ncbi:MAG: hypothetical protein Q9186_002040 [Xanthomendoza sp. 1 TL-2023]
MLKVEGSGLPELKLKHNLIPDRHSRIVVQNMGTVLCQAISEHDVLANNDVVVIIPPVLLASLLVALVDTVGLVAVLDVVVGQPDPMQTNKQERALHDVVIEDDKLDVTTAIGVVVGDRGTTVIVLELVNVLPLAPDGHPAPLHEMVADRKALVLVELAVTKKLPDVTTDDDDGRKVILDNTVWLPVVVGSDTPGTDEIDIVVLDIVALLTVGLAVVTLTGEEDGPVIELWLFVDAIEKVLLPLDLLDNTEDNAVLKDWPLEGVVEGPTLGPTPEPVVKMLEFKVDDPVVKV